MSLQILQFTNQTENLPPTKLTHASHSQSSLAFTTQAARSATSTRMDSSRSNSQQPASTVATHQEATHILDMTGQRALPSSCQRRRHNIPNDIRPPVTQQQK